MKRWYVYLVACADGAYYCGATVDVERRIDEHNRGVGARYTRGRGPVTLIAVAGPLEKGAALSLEAKVKRTKKDKKAALLSGA